MKNKVKMCLYDESFNEELISMLKEFSLETFNYEATPNINEFVNFHYAIYIVEVDGEIAGFTSFAINTCYGLAEKTVSNDYIYIRKGFRRSRAMHYIGVQSGVVCNHLGLDLEHYYVEDSGSIPFIGRLKGKKIYNAYKFKASEVISEAKKLQNKL
ncbi:MAG: hypothetical protein ACPG9K_00935 [Poseidonibacter sp.]